MWWNLTTIVVMKKTYKSLLTVKEQLTQGTTNKKYLHQRAKPTIIISGKFER